MWTGLSGVAKARKRRKVPANAGTFTVDGAEGESRTPTGEPPLDPEPSVSTNSTTSAQEGLLAKRRVVGKRFF